LPPFSNALYNHRDDTTKQFTNQDVTPISSLPSTDRYLEGGTIKTGGGRDPAAAMDDNSRIKDLLIIFWKSICWRMDFWNRRMIMTWMN